MARQVRLWLQGLAIGFAIITPPVALEAVVNWLTGKPIVPLTGDQYGRVPGVAWMVLLVGAPWFIASTWVDDVRAQRRWIALRFLDRLSLPTRVLVGIGCWLVLSSAVAAFGRSAEIAVRTIEILAFVIACIWSMRRTGNGLSHSRWRVWAEGELGHGFRRQDLVLAVMVMLAGAIIDYLWSFAFGVSAMIALALLVRRRRDWKREQERSSGSTLVP